MPMEGENLKKQERRVVKHSKMSELLHSFNLLLFLMKSISFIEKIHYKLSLLRENIKLSFNLQL